MGSLALTTDEARTRFPVGTEVEYDPWGVPGPQRATVTRIEKRRIYVRLEGRRGECWFEFEEAGRLRVVGDEP